MSPPKPFNKSRRDGTFRQYDKGGVYSNETLQEHDTAALSTEHREELWGGGVILHVWSNPLFLRSFRAETHWLSKFTGSRLLNGALLVFLHSMLTAIFFAAFPESNVAHSIPVALMVVILLVWLLAMFLRPAMLSTGLSSLEELRLTPLSPVEIVTGMLWGHAISLALPFLFLWPGLLFWGLLKWPAQPFIWGAALFFGPLVVLSSFAGSAIALSYAIAEFCNPMQHVRSLAMTMFLGLVLIAPLVALSILFEDAGTYLFSGGFAITSIAMAASGQQRAVIHLRFRFD